jgi:predicted  nucleic acid-binding Zn-ribbon protein
MLPDIHTMIELQRRWDSVLHGRSEISSAKTLIAAEEKALVAASQAHTVREKELSAAKADLKAKEVDLLQTEALLEKLQAKSYEAVSSRELKAVESETATATEKKGVLEEAMLSLMDAIVSRESALAASKDELTAKVASVKEKTATMKERISRFEGIVAENEDLFKAGLETLSPTLKSRFGRMVTSVEGKGIVFIEGEHCGGCRFTLPFDLRRETLQGDKLMSCPHCGKYIYARDEHSS